MHNQEQQPFNDHYSSSQRLLLPVKNWTILLKQSSLAYMSMQLVQPEYYINNS